MPHLANLMMTHAAFASIISRMDKKSKSFHVSTSIIVFVSMAGFIVRSNARFANPQLLSQQNLQIMILIIVINKSITLKNKNNLTTARKISIWI